MFTQISMRSIFYNLGILSWHIEYKSIHDLIIATCALCFNMFSVGKIYFVARQIVEDKFASFHTEHTNAGP